jgi:hypothetical protein
MYPRPLRLLVRLSDGVVEGLALNLGDLELESTGLARAIGTRKSASAPWRAYKHIRNLKNPTRHNNSAKYVPPWTSARLVSWPKAEA